MGYYIQTYSGRRFEYGAASPDVALEDIAHHLALINRFTGATRYPYSVGQHSCLVARLVKKLGGTPLAQLIGLLHDGHESYINDLATPYQEWLKSITPEGVPDLIELAKTHLDGKIYKALGLPSAGAITHRLVKRGDHAAFIIEASQLFQATPAWLDEWASVRQIDVHGEGLWESIHETPWYAVESDFLLCYENLLKEVTAEGELPCSA